MSSAIACEITLQNLIRQALEELNLTGPSVFLEIPKIRAHGDLSVSVAMQLASVQKRPPMEIAAAIVDRTKILLQQSPLTEDVASVEVKPPGFINFTLSPVFFHKVLREIISNPLSYGKSALGSGKKALVEFVSANPTGPLSVAHGRQAAVGDALASVLDYAGYAVSREYYLNDEGTQIDLLGASILARARETAGASVPFPENGYKGSYVSDLGRDFIQTIGIKALEKEGIQKQARDFGVHELTKVIRGELDQFGVRFDNWFPQSSLNDDKYLEKTLDLLRDRRYLYKQEGAWWLKSTDFGDDKDRVVIRSDGRLTYIAADIAYHRRKFEKGFDLLVNLLGPDHHGYITRLKAAVQAMGFSAEGLHIRIVQLCTLKRGGETIPMSTREGQFITLTQVMQEVGVDASRFFFLLRKMDAPLEFDLELAKKQSPENPVYYIQYAHARISRIMENWDKQKPAGSIQKKYSHLSAPEETALFRLLREFPGVIEASARALEPFGIVSYLQQLAEGFHRFYDTHRVIGEDAEITGARLDLIRAVQIVLATGLRLLGVSTPDKM